MNRELIKKIVKASGISKGEMVLIHFWGEDADKQIANDFMCGITGMGASPVLIQQARTINRDMFSVADQTCFNEEYFKIFEHFDVVLDVFAYRPIVLEYEIEEKQYDYYRNYIAKLFGSLVKCKKFLQIRIPTVANAEESNLNPDEYIFRMNAAYDIDYEKVLENCSEVLERLKSKKTLRVFTGEKCVLYLDITDREWIIDAGDGDLPCGEVYIAPQEHLTNGEVHFEQIYLDNKRYENITMSIRGGRLVACNQDAVMKYYRMLPEENRIVCEFGLGMNPGVTELCGYIPLDEKMINTFHIALGANTMFGGKNQASDHIDFVGKGTVEELE